MQVDPPTSVTDDHYAPQVRHMLKIKTMADQSEPGRSIHSFIRLGYVYFVRLYTVNSELEMIWKSVGCLIYVHLCQV